MAKFVSCSRLITILFLIVLLISRIFVVYLKEQANFLFELEMWIFIYVFEKQTVISDQ